MDIAVVLIGVLVLVVVAFLLFRKKPEALPEGKAPEAGKKGALPAQKGAEPEAAPKAQQPPDGAVEVTSKDVLPAETVKQPPPAPMKPKRDVAGLRKGL